MKTYQIVIKTTVAATILLATLMIASPASAGDTTLYRNYPGTSARDWSAPAAVIDGDTIYETYPGTSARDWSAPSYQIESRGTHHSDDRGDYDQLTPYGLNPYAW